MSRKIFAAFPLLCLSLLLLASCQKNETGKIDLTPKEEKGEEDVEATYSFSHPCAMYTEEDFSRVREELSSGSVPAVTAAFNALKNSCYSQLSREPEPQELIVRGDPKGTGLSSENYGYAMRDAAAAYQTALIWKLSGDESYAKKSIQTLNAWAQTCKKITSNDSNKVLAAGAQGYTFACAAEIMLGYSGWNAGDVATFKQWMKDVFATVNKSFLDHKDSNTCALHCWSNWDLVNMCSYLAIGILTEDSSMVNFVVNYFYNGAGNGCIKRLINGDLLDDPLGSGEKLAQDQESGRDQGHAMMSAMVTANLAQMAYSLYTVNKGNADAAKLDFFAANDNALLALGEYVALSNLRNGTDNANQSGQWLVAAANMPFNRLEYCVDCSCRDKNHSAVHTTLADDSGRGSVRPGWEIYLSHYSRVKGLSSGYKYVQMMADKMRPECGVGDDRYGHNSGAFDQLGWGTLMLYRQ